MSQFHWNNCWNTTPEGFHDKTEVDKNRFLFEKVEAEYFSVTLPWIRMAKKFNDKKLITAPLCTQM